MAARHYPPLKERFEALFQRRSPDECWPWLGAMYGDGYGSFSYEGRDIGAHRAAWLIYKGQIPHGLFILHECDFRGCVNYERHLFAGTHQINMADMVEKGRASRGEMQPGHKLTEDEVRAIRSIYAAGGISHRALAKRFNVSRGTTWQIINDERWRHL